MGLILSRSLPLDFYFIFETRLNQIENIEKYRFNVLFNFKILNGLEIYNDLQLYNQGLFYDDNFVVNSSYYENFF